MAEKTCSQLPAGRCQHGGSRGDAGAGGIARLPASPVPREQPPGGPRAGGSQHAALSLPCEPRELRAGAPGLASGCRAPWLGPVGAAAGFRVPPTSPSPGVRLASPFRVRPLGNEGRLPAVLRTPSCR